jgi:hypothetical protein
MWLEVFIVIDGLDSHSRRRMRPAGGSRARIPQSRIVCRHVFRPNAEAPLRDAASSGIAVAKDAN